MTNEDVRLKRLKYRAWHRGFREADLILGPFADRYAATFSPAQLDELERLLEEPDTDLYNWIIEREAPPPELDGEMLALLRRFRFEAFEARGPGRGG